MAGTRADSPDVTDDERALLRRFIAEWSEPSATSGEERIADILRRALADVLAD